MITLTVTGGHRIGTTGVTDQQEVFRWIVPIVVSILYIVLDLGITGTDIGGIGQVDNMSLAPLPLDKWLQICFRHVGVNDKVGTGIGGFIEDVTESGISFLHLVDVYDQIVVQSPQR